MSEDIKAIADEMQSIAFTIYEARTNRLLTSAKTGQETDRDSEVIDTLQHTHDILVALSASLDTWVGVKELKEAVSFEDLDVAVEEPEEVNWTSQALAGLIDGENVTVSQVSEETGISRTTINNIIAGRTQNPHEKTLRTLESYFELEEGYLSE